MSDLIFYHTGIIQLSSDDTNWVNASFGNAKVSVSPEYITHKNILSNEINILKGYKLDVELELFFLKSDTTNYFKIDEFIEILRKISHIENGIYGYNNDIYLRFFQNANSTDNAYFYKKFTLNKLNSDLLLTNYVSDNMKLGQKLEIKLSHSNLLGAIPFWQSLDSTYTNAASGIAGKVIATDQDWTI